MPANGIRASSHLHLFLVRPLVVESTSACFLRVLHGTCFILKNRLIEERAVFAEQYHHLFI